MTKTTIIPTRTGELATLYQVTPKTITRWRARGVPIRDLPRLAVWASGQTRLPANFLARVIELRDAAGEARPASDAPVSAVPAVDPDWVEFQRLVASQPSGDPKASMVALGRAREFAAFKLCRASEAGDQPSMKFHADLLIRFESAIHDAELRARKLGIDVGDLFSGEDVDRLGRAVGFWLMNSADAVISQISFGLTAATATGPLDREAIRHAVEPVILAERALAPLVRACKTTAPIRLPVRFVDAVREGLAACIEDGLGEFDRLYAAPVPRPTAPGAQDCAQTC